MNCSYSKVPRSTDLVLTWAKKSPTQPCKTIIEHTWSKKHLIVRTKSFSARRNVFQRSSIFEISGLAISEKISDVKTLTYKYFQKLRSPIKINNPSSFLNCILSFPQTNSLNFERKWNNLLIIRLTQFNGFYHCRLGFCQVFQINLSFFRIFESSWILCLWKESHDFVHG